MLDSTTATAMASVGKPQPLDSTPELPPTSDPVEKDRPTTLLNQLSVEAQDGENAACTAAQGLGVLVSEIQEALPDVTDSCLQLLLESFKELGVKTKEDALMLAQPENLLKILGADNAKKLVAHLNKHSTSTGLIVTDGGWDPNDRSARENDKFRGTMPEWCLALLQALVAAESQVSAACTEMSENWQTGHEERMEILAETRRNVDEKLTQADRIHASTVEELEASRNRTAQAHEKMMREVQEENERFAKEMEEMHENRKREEMQECEKRRQLQRKHGSSVNKCLVG